MGVRSRLLRCRDSFFFRYSVWLNVLDISPYSVTSGWECLVSGALVYITYVSRLRSLVSVSSVALLKTRSATFFLSTLNWFFSFG